MEATTAAASQNLGAEPAFSEDFDVASGTRPSTISQRLFAHPADLF